MVSDTKPQAPVANTREIIAGWGRLHFSNSVGVLGVISAGNTGMTGRQGHGWMGLQTVAEHRGTSMKQGS